MLRVREGPLFAPGWRPGTPAWRAIPLCTASMRRGGHVAGAVSAGDGVDLKTYRNGEMDFYLTPAWPAPLLLRVRRRRQGAARWPTQRAHTWLAQLHTFSSCSEACAMACSAAFSPCCSTSRASARASRSFGRTAACVCWRAPLVHTCMLVCVVRLCGGRACKQRAHGLPSVHRQASRANPAGQRCSCSTCWRWSMARMHPHLGTDAPSPLTHVVTL